MLIILSLRFLRFFLQFLSNVPSDDFLKDCKSCYKEIWYYFVYFPRKRRKIQEILFNFKRSQNLTRLALIEKHYNFFLFLSSSFLENLLVIWFFCVTSELTFFFSPRFKEKLKFSTKMYKELLCLYFTAIVFSVTLFLDSKATTGKLDGNFVHFFVSLNFLDGFFYRFSVCFLRKYKKIYMTIYFLAVKFFSYSITLDKKIS